MVDESHADQDEVVKWRPSLSFLWLALPLVAVFVFRSVQDFLHFGSSGPLFSILLVMALFIAVPIVINVIEWGDVAKFRKHHAGKLTFVSHITDSVRQIMPENVKSNFVQVVVDGAGIGVCEYGKGPHVAVLIAKTEITSVRLGPAGSPVRPSLLVMLVSGQQIVLEPLISTRLRTKPIWGRDGMAMAADFRLALSRDEPVR